MQICTSPQTDKHGSTLPLSFFTDRMPFLPLNQQHQSTEGPKAVCKAVTTLCMTVRRHITACFGKNLLPLTSDQGSSLVSVQTSHFQIQTKTCAPTIVSNKVSRSGAMCPTNGSLTWAYHADTQQHTHTHTHNRFTAGLEYVRVHPGQQVPER